MASLTLSFDSEIDNKLCCIVLYCIQYFIVKLGFFKVDSSAKVVVVQ